MIFQSYNKQFFANMDRSLLRDSIRTAPKMTLTQFKNLLREASTTYHSIVTPEGMIDQANIAPLIEPCRGPFERGIQ